MYERLVENWLDNASEKSFQGPFCQMLAYQGHRIVHSSRHSQIELGKDVITVDPDGIPCAYQLKGNPGGRLRLQQFREIQNQLFELVNMPIPVDSLRSKSHRSFLVTNGLVEEETRLAISELNLGLQRNGLPNRKLEIVERGDLLKMAEDLGHSLWPSEFDKKHLMIELLAEKGDDKFPIPKLHDLLIDVLGLDETSANKLRARDLRRRITSAALLVSIGARNFQQKENLYALVSAWVLYSAYAIAACERHNLSFARNAATAVDLAVESIKDSLVALAVEVLSLRLPLQENVMVDPFVYKARFTLLLSLMSLLWFWCEEEGWPETIDRDRLEEFLNTGFPNLYLWGEAAIPQVLCYYWFLRATSPYSKWDYMLADILRRIVDPRLIEQGHGLAQPYYDFEDVARHILSPILGRDQDPLRDEFSGSMSYFAESLMHLLVRTGLKLTCKSIWPDVTRLWFVSFVPDSKWQYCLLQTENGEYLEVQPPLTKQWDDLVEEARHVDCPEVSKSLSSNRILHALFLILLPHRSTPSAVCALARRFDRTWFIPPPITAEDST